MLNEESQGVTERHRLVLVVDDQPIARSILQELLEQKGYEVVQASNGQEGLDLFKAHLPAFVFMDAMMPVMDGFEATRQIKALPEGQYTPIIFLTALDSPEDLKRSIQVGGDDFITKPPDPDVLAARLMAAERTRGLYINLREQHQELLEHLAIEKANERLAHKVFTHAVESHKQNHPGLVTISHSADSFSGDLVLYAPMPEGGFRVLVGDFTGHGFAAAICALPVCEIFYAMTRRRRPQVELLQEINKKLCRMLPNDRFMAATCVDIDFEHQTLTCWSGGMPPIDLLKGQELQKLVPKGLALGILEGYNFDPDLVELPLSSVDRLLLMSDGFHDVSNVEGQRLDQTPLINEFYQRWADATTKTSVLTAEILVRHVGDLGLDDDVTLVELDIAVLAQNQALLA